MRGWTASYRLLVTRPEIDGAPDRSPKPICKETVMHPNKQFPRTVTTMAALVALIFLATGAEGRAPRPDAEVIPEWNALLESVVPAGGLSPPRYYAMLHVAMFDAVNSVEHGYGRYRFSVWASPVASPEAAAAQAAHDVLVAQFPNSKDAFDK